MKSLFVSESRQNEINALRTSEYAQATGFAVDLSTLKWKQSDNESYIMATEEEGLITSTMRGEVITSRELLEMKLECPWSFPLHLEYPVLLLSRAATLSTHRGLGLNLVLRYWFLKFAFHHGLPFVIGTFVAGSPRENTLQEMGYEFFENKLGWQKSTYRSQRPVQVVALDMKKNGNQALQYSEEKVGNPITRLHFEGPWPDLKIVKNL